MKNKIKVLIIYTIFYALTGISNSCGEPDYYKVSSINSNLLRLKGIEIIGSAKIKSYLVERIDTVEDTVKIRYDSLGIEINIEKILAQSSSLPNNNPVFQNAYALSKAVNYERIFAIEITSDKDYNSLYPAGSNLNELFSISEEHLVYGVNLNEFLSRYDAGTSTVLYKILFAPEKEEVRTLKIKYITENNHEFEIVVRNLIILK